MSLRTALSDYLKDLNSDLKELQRINAVADLRVEVKNKEFGQAAGKAQDIAYNMVAAEELSSIVENLNLLLEENDDVDEDVVEDEDFDLEVEDEDFDLEVEEEEELVESEEY